MALDDGSNREIVRLDSLDVGLHIPPMVWGVQYNYSLGAALIVFASEEYDRADYIDLYDDFLREVGRK